MFQQIISEKLNADFFFSSFCLGISKFGWEWKYFNTKFKQYEIFTYKKKETKKGGGARHKKNFVLKNTWQDENKNNKRSKHKNSKINQAADIVT